MEQYSYQQPVVTLPAKKPIGLQVTALILGIVGMALAYLAYFGTIFSNIGVVAATEYNDAFTQGASAASAVTIIADVVIAILCLVAMILAIVGLVRSIRRPTRTVKGIVMSAIGLNLSAVGFVLMVIGTFIGGIFRLLASSGVFH